MGFNSAFKGLIFKTLKILLKHFGEVAPTCFALPIRPSSGSAHAVLCAVTRLDAADVCSLIVCVVCGRMSLPSVCMCVRSCCPGEVWSWNIPPTNETFLTEFFQAESKIFRSKINELTTPVCNTAGVLL